MSVVTGTNHTIVDGLTALPDKPAAAAPSGSPGQRQTLQPAGGPPPAPPEAQIKTVSASNDLWIGGAGRSSRSSSLTGSGSLRPACLRLDLGKKATTEPSSRGERTSADRSRCGPLRAKSGQSQAPVSLPRAHRPSNGTEHILCARANRPAGCGDAQSPRLPLPPGRRGPTARLLLEQTSAPHAAKLFENRSQ